MSSWRQSIDTDLIATKRLRLRKSVQLKNTSLCTIRNKVNFVSQRLFPEQQLLDIDSAMETYNSKNM